MDRIIQQSDEAAVDQAGPAVSLDSPSILATCHLPSSEEEKWDEDAVTSKKNGILSTFPMPCSICTQRAIHHSNMGGQQAPRQRDVAARSNSRKASREVEEEERRRSL